MPGHELGDRVLYLEPRVDLHEVEVASAGPQELHGAGTDVSHALSELRGELRQLSSLGRRHHGRRRLLDDLLMSPLNRALAFAEAHHVAVAVGEELHLDMPRVGDGLLEVDVGVAEGHCADPLDPLEDLVDLLRRLDLLDTLAPAAAIELEEYGVVDHARRFAHRGCRRQHLGRARHNGDAGRRRDLATVALGLNGAQDLGRRPDPDCPGLLHCLREIRILGEEPVAGMDGVRPRLPDGPDERLDVEVALDGVTFADADGLLSLPREGRPGVGVRVDRRCLQTEIVAGPYDPAHDLAPIGDQDLADHEIARSVLKSSRRRSSARRPPSRPTP